MESHLKVARTITNLMENKFGIGGFRIGLDPIIGAIPGIGDVITVAISFYLVWIGVQMKLPQEKVLEMVGNVIVDFLIGFFPIIGDLTDIVYKANTKNLRILEEFASRPIVDAEVLDK
jgi:hypothetical protein